MRIKTPLAALLLAALAVACDQSAPTEPSADQQLVEPVEVEARGLSQQGPGTPTVTVITVVLPGAIDPCTGHEHTVTFVNTVHIHTLGNNTLLRADRVLTTDDGYEGRGHATLVTNNNVSTFLVADILTHPETGRKVRHIGTLIFDLENMIAKVSNSQFECIRG